MSAAEFFACYFTVISIVTVVLTIGDKLNSKKNGKRVPEDFLLTLGLLGGALAEYITMKLIRHKTKHKKFMLILPAEIIIHIVIVVLIVLYA
ncbi:MAG: DUF1294 domain-containing protein [Eubacterium sp.]|nr:DUF1294 domain-containing protein [Eubacterium sp.]